MAFNTPFFIFLFAPLFFSIYLSVGGAWKNTVALAGSVLFYVWAEPLFAVVVVSSSLLDHIAVLAIARSDNSRMRKTLLVASLVQGLAPLLYVKYAAFAYAMLGSLFGFSGATPGWLAPALPLAVSFVTFEKITYLVDVYRGTGRPARRFGDYLTYVLLFPKLIAGPIVKYHDIEAALLDRRVTALDFSQGLMRFAAGLAKKTLIADALAPYADTAFSAPPQALGPSSAWIGLVAFTFQIYFDFSAYSDMAIGMSRMMGFRLKENFDQPYLAIGLSGFWHRWHISLSTWVRDYLYVPLGGNRVAEWKIYRNLLVCFLLSGLWHGANMTFVAWGLFHGLFLLADRIGFTGLLLRLGTLAGTVATFVIVMMSWVFFRAPDLDHAMAYFQALFRVDRLVPPVVFLDTNLTVVLAVAVAMSFIPWRKAKALAGMGWNGDAALPRPAAWLIVFGFGWGCARMMATGFTPFLYFRF